jgi:hypothetical protein
VQTSSHSQARMKLDIRPLVVHCIGTESTNIFLHYLLLFHYSTLAARMGCRIASMAAVDIGQKEMQCNCEHVCDAWMWVWWVWSRQQGCHWRRSFWGKLSRGCFTLWCAWQNSIDEGTKHKSCQQATSVTHEQRIDFSIDLVFGRQNNSQF